MLGVALAQEPDLIEDVKDACPAAVAEHLSSVYWLPTPAWVEQHGRPLKRAFFAGELESPKGDPDRGAVESPAAFRRRLLFGGKDALDRPRRLAGSSS